MKWFRKKDEPALEKSESFFDYDDSRDPWDLPTVRLFGKKSPEKGKPSKTAQHRFSLAERFARDEDSPFWENSEGQVKREPGKMNPQHLEAASQRYAATQRTPVSQDPVVITPHQRLSDVSPEDFRERQPSRSPWGPTLSARPTQNLQGCDIRFSHDEEGEPPLSPRVFIAEDDPQPVKEARLGQSSSPLQTPYEGQRPSFEENLRSAWRPPERPTPDPVKTVPTSREPGPASWTTDSPVRETRPPFFGEELDNSGPRPSGQKPRPGPENPPKGFEGRKRFVGFRPWLKGLAFVFALAIIAVVLLMMLNRSTPAPIDEEGLMTIPSPEHIKVRPTEPSRALIPYQDELIYGQLDNLPEPEVTNPIRPVEETVVAPPAPAPVPSSLPPSQEPDDEYLDETPQKDERAQPMRASSPEAVHTQQKLARFMEEEDQKKGHPGTGPIKRESGKKEWSRSSKEAGSDLNRNATQMTLFAPTKVPSSPVPLKRQPQSPQASPRPVARAQHFPQDMGTQKRSTVALKGKKPVYLQLGALTSIETARTEATRLAAKYQVFAPYRMVVRSTTTSSGRGVYLILLGPIESEERAQALLKQTSGRFAIRP